jgi:FlaA1/EpsC-like NDP-sugar epimerase/ActR/RegA family two-component response regulator
MLSLVARRNFWIMVAMDGALCLGAYYAAYLVRFDGIIPVRDLEAFQKTVLWIVAGKLAFLFSFRVYRGMWRYTSIHDLLHLLRALLAGSGVGVFGILIVRRFEGFSRGVFVIDFILSLLFLGGLRLMIRLLYSHQRAKQRDDKLAIQPAPLKRLVVIGAGAAGEKLLREVKENRRFNHEVVGFIDDNPSKNNMTLHGVPVLGTVKDLAEIATNRAADEIVIAVPSASATEMRRIVGFCKSAKLPFRTVPGISELIDGKVSVSAIREVRYEDLLGRRPVEIDANEIGGYLTGKRVMVTGAAGSIGSELCRQIAAFKPSLLVVVDRNESGLYEIEMEFKANFPELCLLPVLTPVQNRSMMQKFFDTHRAQVVFHAAAYKHVPMMEIHPWEAVYNNVIATQVLLELCGQNGVEKCVIVSTDKAVRPSNVMGATKRLTELLVQACAKASNCRFMAVRFGNVIGSIGSVVPLFRKQIAQGGPVTVTHKDMTRYFMTIPEACRLILQAGAIGEGGEIFVLKMGIPIRIDSLARDMITLSGLRPDEDIRIEYTGLRPGEKLYEELITEGEDIVQTKHEKIMVLQSRNGISIQDLHRDIRKLVQCASDCDTSGIKDQLQSMIHEYTPLGAKLRGSTFVPAIVNGHSQKNATPVNGTKRNAEGKQGLSILVVDDEETIAELVAERLTSVGYSSAAVHSAQEALSALEHEQYDLVLADLMLSDMKGTELLQTIRHQNKKIEVIIMTGYATIESAIEAVQEGAAEYIAKPFTFAELQTVIGRTLLRKTGT